MKLMQKQLNFIILVQILHSNIFPILSPKFSKNHDFQIYQNRMKFHQKKQNFIQNHSILMKNHFPTPYSNFITLTPNASNVSLSRATPLKT